MTIRTMLGLTTVAAVLIASPALAQNAPGSEAAPPESSATDADAKAAAAMTAPIVVQHFRAHDKRGLNVFEPPKEAGVPFSGFQLGWGAAFTQQFQSLSHENAAAPNVLPHPSRPGQTYDANGLIEIGSGFNNATANLYLNAQLAPGIRVSLTTFLSSRHHPDAWVKDGYLLIDDSPLDVAPLKRLMEFVTVRAGHFEINYGDAHFRRTDNGNALYNPFVGNYIMDAYTTEVGAEVYVRSNGFLAMGAVTGGEIKGNITQPEGRGAAYIGKLGFDRQLTDDLRLRLMGSVYTTERSLNNTLYGGDRAGSRYYFVMENPVATEAAQFTSGHINPGLRSKVTAVVFNPFVKLGGLELFGVAEQAKGRAANETADRTWNQYAGDVVYRFLGDERLFVGGRYNVVDGTLAGGADVSIDRVQLGGGWFLTPTMLMKAEYVVQNYNDFPTDDIRSGGKFKGFVIEGVVAF